MRRADRGRIGLLATGAWFAIVRHAVHNAHPVPVVKETRTTAGT